MTDPNTLLVAAGGISAESNLVGAIEIVERVVAIDGGIGHLKAIEHVPDVVIGDLDSARPEDIEWASNGGAEIIHSEGQDESDLAKALNLCCERGWDDIAVNGLIGGRPDHEMAAMMAICDADESLTIGAHLRRTFVFRFTAGYDGRFTSLDTFSIFSFQKSVISLSDCKWELAEQEIDVSTRGLSNHAEGEVKLTVHSGGPVLAYIIY